jgi:hypothetical protein
MRSEEKPAYTIYHFRYHSGDITPPLYYSGRVIAYHARDPGFNLSTTK